MNICALIHPYDEVTIKKEELVLMEELDEQIWRKASSYHQQQPASQQNAAQQTVAPPSTVNPSDTQQQPPPANGQPPQPFQSVLRLHDDPANPAPPAPKASRKRKTPPTAQEQQPPPQPPPPAMHPPPGVMPPPPHSLMHPPHMGPPPPLPFQYIPQDYTPGGLTHPPPPPPGHTSGSPPQEGAGRTLSQSKRAEQNRKAQRAFRERRDQHVKALESRSQLLDAALASADEANRRWEDCRQLVDQLRIENAALRTLIAQLQGGPPPPHPHPVPLPEGIPPPPPDAKIVGHHPLPAANPEKEGAEGTSEPKSTPP